MSNPNWMDFLRLRGATPIADGNGVSFPPSTGDVQVTPLLSHSLLTVQGTDSQKFLQGQLSCDLNQLSTSNSLLGSNCTPKGNVIGAMRLLRTAEDQILLRLPTATSPSVLANLGKYIVFSKATITDSSDAYVGIGLYGAGAENLVETLFAVQLSQPGQQHLDNDKIIVRVPGSNPRFELWMPTETAQSLWPTLCENAAPAASHDWVLAEIQAGLVVLDQESVDSYIPQMLNLQAVGGISFTKGCYTGQEVIARLQYRGKLKKVLIRGHVDCTIAPTAGMSVHSPTRKSVGKVLCAAPLVNGSGETQGYELQAVVAKAALDENQLRLQTQEGPTLEVLTLPYELEAQLFER